MAKDPEDSLRSARNVTMVPVLPRSPCPVERHRLVSGPAALLLAVPLAVLVGLAVRWLRKARALRDEYAASRIAWSDFHGCELGPYYLPNSVHPGVRCHPWSQ